MGGASRLAWMNLSILIEQDLLASLGNYNPVRLEEQLEKTCYLSQVLNSTGHLFDWEFDQLLFSFTDIPLTEISFERLYAFYRNVTRSINWGSGMIYAEFGDDVDRFSAFEPRADAFMDDRIRSSALLHLGRQASGYNNYIIDKAGWRNSVFGKNSSAIQGINPGFAKGKIVCVEQAMTISEYEPNAIYAFRKSPADLEPVAGILSISEGNVVSHLQLLARNLGIPNATITEELYMKLKEYDGREVFYAISNKGGVNLKLAEDMDGEESALFVRNTIDEEIMRVPTEMLELDSNRVFALTELDASSSGRICGPKAANFARLKKLFPDQLVDGLVIPFAIFRDHMDQVIPAEGVSYWAYLESTFQSINRLKEEGKAEKEIEEFSLARLEKLRAYIKNMPLKPDFIQDLEERFIDELESPLGKIPVFLRSDTNMEDLKDFTGAGLNLTIFNTLEKAAILQGIKDVWASPYTERS